MSASDVILDKGLPVNLDAERFVLGSILLDDSLYVQTASAIAAEDFALEKHRVMFSRMADMYGRGQRIDRITLYDELLKRGEAEACDGLSYLSSLDDGMPRLQNIDAYAEIVREKSRLRRIIFAGQRMIDRALLGQDESGDVLDGAQKALVDIGGTSEASTLLGPREIIEQAEGGLDGLISGHQGTHTGFQKFDDMTGGLNPGELFILAARPSHGKTALALNMGQNVATNTGKPVPVFSLEMTRESLLLRALCSWARVDSGKMRAGFISREERARVSAAASAMAESPLLIDDTSGMALMQIHAKLRRLKQERGDLGLVIIDYLQLMSGRGRFENRNQEISGLSRGLKLLAKEMACPTMVLSQLSRAPEDRSDHRPQLSDLRDSGAIEQDADLVAFIFRPEVYDPQRADLRGHAELILAKQRNGPTGTIKLMFLKHCTRFENMTVDLEPAAPWQDRED